MAFNDLDESNDRMRYRNYAHRIGQRAEEESIEAKLVVMGNTGVGKSSLVVRYTENRFSLSTTATTGALFVTHKTNFDDFHVKLQIWDTAGT
ncbi:Ras- protein Rab-21 [Serendipita sp. 399]|nr:Ras- protein Rab-21 [Serendipita sp. 399]